MGTLRSLRGILFSWFSVSFYRDVAQRGKGTGLGYLLLLLAILWVPQMVRLHGEVHRYLDNKLPELIQQLPEISIQKGKVTADCAMPCRVKIAGRRGTLEGVIDTTGKTSSLNEPGTNFLLSENKFFFRFEKNDVGQAVDLSSVESFSITRERLMGWAKALGQWAALSSWCVAVLGSFVFRAVLAVLYSLFGLMFVRLLREPLDYSQILRLTVFAMTPMLALSTLRDLFSWVIPYGPLVSFLIVIGYLFLAIKANASTDSEPSSSALEQNRGAPQSTFWRILRLVPLSSMLLSISILLIMFLMGGIARITAWNFMPLVTPLLGLLSLLSIIFYTLVKRRISRVWVATLIVALISFLPLSTRVRGRAYPSSIEHSKPAATVRLPANVPLKVFWGGDAIETNYHAGFADQRWAYDLAVSPLQTGSSKLED